MRWRLAIVVAALVAIATPAVAEASLELVSVKRPSARLTELTFRTPNLAGETSVDVLTPTEYDPAGSVRYPVVYLLHGSGGDHTAWMQKGDLAAMTADYPAIFVMPDGGDDGGFYVNSYNDGAFGPPAWESYHIDELVPWIDEHFLTTATRAGRAIAGLSAGGYGTMHYAARHPDLFVAAAAYSPAVDNTDAVEMGQNQAKYFTGIGGDAFGSAATNMVYRRGHNPLDLAENLRGLYLEVRTGNGLPDGAGRPDPVEADVHGQATRFHDALTRLDIAHAWDDYGAGSHTWPYWQSDLRLTLENLRGVFAHPPPPPARIAYRSIDPDYTVHGWHVAVSRANREFSELRDADEHGFTLRGSGTAAVTTPTYFPPGGPVQVTVGTTSEVLRADDQGRLIVPVDLGPSNTYDEYSPEAELYGAAVYEQHVTFA